jgi:ribosome assembly protein YihI (activator of Der GTPase)
MTTEQFERLTMILEGLQAVRGELYPNAQKFIDDQIERLEQYGERMMVSPKQDKWMTDLYREFVGTDPELVASAEKPQGRPGDRNDDDDPGY